MLWWRHLAVAVPSSCILLGGCFVCGGRCILTAQGGSRHPLPPSVMATLQDGCEPLCHMPKKRQRRTERDMIRTGLLAPGSPVLFSEQQTFGFKGCSSETAVAPINTPFSGASWRAGLLPDWLIEYSALQWNACKL